MQTVNSFAPAGRAPVAIVLGTNDVATAVAHALHGAGYGVVLSRDAAHPVLRRRMAFDEALETGRVEIEGLEAVAADTLVQIMMAFLDRRFVCVTTMELGDLVCLGLIDVLVDARMRMRHLAADIRPYARLTIGLGPGFTSGRTVDAAIETAPEAVGIVPPAGSTLAAHGRSALLGGAGRERFARAPRDGLWRTRAEIGDAVRAGESLGTCAGIAVAAPLSGRLRGLVRDATDLRAGTKVAEVDPRPDGEASWLGIADRPRRIAAATLDAIRTLDDLCASGQDRAGARGGPRIWHS
ncbi:hypothetical protein [Methylobacterium sp. WSM2598]|uniref:hypothetical protein n=1 Tax=Methylobacterium sp. WSM2598 TaxID=398261 RepID=UPI000361EB7A|nr:hypothetical protein [Methylobacterium sp. WSM2598]